MLSWFRGLRVFCLPLRPRLRIERHWLGHTLRRNLPPTAPAFPQIHHRYVLHPCVHALGRSATPEHRYISHPYVAGVASIGGCALIMNIGMSVLVCVVHAHLSASSHIALQGSFVASLTSTCASRTAKKLVSPAMHCAGRYLCPVPVQV